MRIPATASIILSQPLPAALLNAVFRVRDSLKGESVDARVYVQGKKIPPVEGAIRVTLKGAAPSESYQIESRGKVIHLIGEGPAGLFYALQTLRQLIVQFGTAMPCMSIKDKPHYPHRGYYLDITRGKVPKVATLKRVIDRLAALKYNQFQLYIEHTYDFRFDPDIAAGCSPLTSDEILELDRYCRERFIDFIPSMTCFGHMGRILSLPAYRSLAEVEFKASRWEEATWRQRMTGATLNPRKPGSKALIEAMLDEYLPLFASGYFNACCDETYDLGRGPNSALARRKGIGALFSQHIRFLQKTCKKYDKRLMFWGDVALHHPEAIPDLPAESVVLDWGYEPTTAFDKAGLFIDHGLETYVCPSVRGYGVVFNQTEEARGNIAGYARAGAARGASGVLVTDWGDLGHFNMYATSLHGMALGAAMAWNPRGDADRDFDRAFSRQLFGLNNVTPARLFSAAGTSAIGSWPFLMKPFDAEPGPLPEEKVIHQAREKAVELLKELKTWNVSPMVDNHDLQELTLACRALLLNADKYMLTRYLHGHSPCDKRALRKKGREFQTYLDEYIRDYAATWRHANKESAIADIQKVFKQLARDCLI